MIDYSEHLMQMAKLTKQMEDALRKRHHSMAYDLSMMLLKETKLLTNNLADTRHEWESRYI
jgi:hypothetical protein